MTLVATAIKPAEKILTYDGDCPMCTSTVATLIRLKLVRPEQTRANYDLTGADLEAAQAAGIRNQLVVLDAETRETRSGVDGLLWVFAENTGHPLFFRMLRLPGIRHLLQCGYEAISYNRRIISVPRHQIVCDCEPEVTLARRLSMVVPLVVLSIVLVGGFGAAVFVGGQLGEALAGTEFAIVAVGSGYLALALAGALLLSGEQRIDYISHLTTTLFIGALVLLPVSLLALLLPLPAVIGLVGLSALASFAMMFAMQRRRTRALKLSSTWVGAWIAALVAGIGATSWFTFGA